MGNLISAFRFLTCIPLPGGSSLELRQLGASSAWFPLVGLFLGGIMVLGDCGLELIFNPSVTAALLIALLALLTGGLHLDGLMDTADGLWGAQERERALVIMRDSRVGAMGVLAAVLVILAKWTLLTSLLSIHSASGCVPKPVLLLIPTFGRWSMVYALCFYAYARPEVGLGKPFAEGAGLYQMVIASLIALLTAWFLGGFTGLASLAGVVLFTAVLTARMAKRLGGLTGDTYGALNELSELAALLLLVGLTG